jgi:hypothetical protein
MKTIKYIAIAFACLTAFSACEKDWDEPSFNGVAPVGNNSINEENIITVAELKTKFASALSQENSCDTIKEDIKIRVRVIGNDIGSKLYKQFAVQDETGALIIAVNKGGMYGLLAEGQEIIMALKDLYIGSYGTMPEIGQPYNGSIGRMNYDIFMQHIKLVGQPDVTKIDTIKNFLPSDAMMPNMCKLVRLENVSFKHVGGLGTFAPDSAVDHTVTIKGGCVSRELVEDNMSKMVVRTSTYAKFASMKLPYDEMNKKPLKCNLVGIATYYSGTNQWQLLIRKESDIEILNQ